MNENLLRQLRGDDVGRATLSPCTKDSPATIEKIPGFGSVKFTFSRFHQRQFGRCFWTCDGAERVR